MYEKLDQYIKQFLNYLTVRQYSASTIESYTLTLNRFKKYCEINKISAEKLFALQTIIDFINQLNSNEITKQKLSEMTRINYISKLRIFFKYLVDNTIILLNPFDSIDKIHSPKRLPKYIPDESEINKILAQIKLNNHFGCRDRAMIELFYSTGIRRKELVNLSIYDVDLINGFIRVIKGKGGKDRIIPVGKIACKHLANYINNARPWLLKNKSINEKTLFLTQFGKKFSPEWVNMRLRQYLEKAGLKNKKISCHSFRHSCATEMLKGKATIRHVQQMLGHTYLSSTQVYTQVLPLDLLDVHKRCHPSWTLFEK